MSYRLIFAEQYAKRAARFLKRHPNLEALHSGFIKLYCRITLELLIQDEQIIPVSVGDHDSMY